MKDMHLEEVYAFRENICIYRKYMHLDERYALRLKADLICMETNDESKEKVL